MEKTLEQRLLDLERRFTPIEKVLYNSELEPLIETEKLRDIEMNGNEYTIKVTFETDKGDFVKVIKQKGYTDKQALYLLDKNILQPKMKELQKAGNIRWYKIKSKQIK